MALIINLLIVLSVTAASLALVIFGAFISMAGFLVKDKSKEKLYLYQRWGVPIK